MSRPPFPVFLRCPKCAKPFKSRLRESYSCLDADGIAAAEAALKATGGDRQDCPYCHKRFNPWPAVIMRPAAGYDFGGETGEEAASLAALEAEIERITAAQTKAMTL